MQEKLIIRGAREHNLKDVSLDLPARLPDRLHRAVRLRQVQPGVRHDLRRGPAPLRRVAVGVRPPVPRPDGQARRRLHRGPLARRSRSTRSPRPRTRARPSARSPRSTTTSACSTPAPAGRTARSAARPIERQTPQQIVDRVLALEEGTRFQVLAPVIRGRKGEYVELFRQLQTQGFSRARVDGETHPLDDPPKLDKQKKHTIEVVVDRLAVKASSQAPADRLGRDRAQPGRRAGASSTSSTSPAKDPRPRAAVLREDGLPQRPPDRHRRARAAVVLVQLARSAPAPSATASAPGWRSTPSWSSPTRRRPSARARSSRGARPTSPTTSCG